MLNYKRLAITLTLGLVCAAGALVPQAAMAGTVDQDQILINSDANLDSGASRAQTFTAGITGTLDKVGLPLRKVGTPSAPLNVAVRNTVGGVPGPTVLASASVPESSVTSGSTDPQVWFAVSAPVTAGTRYAITAYSNTGGGQIYYWGLHTGNPYTSGERFSATNASGAGPWTGGLDGDMSFVTTVVPGVPGAGTATGQRAAALKKCKKKNSKKARKKCKKKARKLPV